MRFPWTNILLLLLMGLQTITGAFGFVEGRETQRWVLWLHGIGAYALVTLLGLKASIILDAWRRKKVWTRQRIGFVILLMLLLITLVLGLLWTFTGPHYLAGFSLVSLHIYTAIPLMVLLLWHSWRMRFVLRLPQTWNRRLFLGSLVATLGGWAIWSGGNRARALWHLPGAARRFTGSYERGSFSGRFPAVSWIADRPSPVNLDTWVLAVGGAVERPFSLTFAQVQALASATTTVTLDCTGGWYTTQEWHGVPLAQLLEMAGLASEAASVTITAVSGYQRRFSLDAAQSHLLATEVAGAPLAHGHGFPLRLVAPEQRGVAWVKWVTRVWVNETGPNWQLPLPLQ